MLLLCGTLSQIVHLAGEKRFTALPFVLNFGNDATTDVFLSNFNISI